MTTSMQNPWLPSRLLAGPGQGLPLTMRRALNGVLVGLLLLNGLILLVKAYETSVPVPSTTSGPPATPLVITDRQEQVQLTLTSQWSVQDRPGFLLFAIDLPQDLIVQAFAESKSDITAIDSRYGDLDRYSELLRTLLAKEMPDAAHGQPRRFTIGGLPAVQSTLSGTFNGVHTTFLHTVVETPETFYQVRGYTTSVNFPKKQSQLAATLMSFRVLRPAVPPAAPPPITQPGT